MKSIKVEKDLSNKKILLRLDLNVPLDGGKITDTDSAGRVIEQVVTPVPNDADADDNTAGDDDGITIKWCKTVSMKRCQ